MPNRHLSYITAAFTLAAMLFVGSHAHAATPVLMLLEHVEGNKVVGVKIEAKRGDKVSPSAGKEFERWTVRAGNAIDTDAQPNDVMVEFYRGKDAQRNLSFAISIRYFRNREGLWVPHYQIIEIPLITRDKDGRWKPLTTIAGASLIMMTSNTLPNAEGYYPSMEFGLSAGLLQIDSWSVK